MAHVRFRRQRGTGSRLTTVGAPPTAAAPTVERSDVERTIGGCAV